ncbi:GNAT family N-acetyltransferase [Rhodospirillaceae bacterium KN72]|uniref:GNAT family N-acetyltransferase n=1 Tax=Pacificispira spongiicola TaxID=2729598 RepID=A0A7Y0HIG3_9PROT|nr:GNAT family N-acetyltransferase [Pacificispira spongiicola]NMM46524.1 GNAT family N-acetyltransferase [Pacificispira spongiicola]
MLTIRRAELADVPALARLYTAFYREDAIPTPVDDITENLTVMVQDDRAGIWVAEADDVPVGMSSATVTFGVEFGWACELEDLYVVPSYRGLGVSRKLLDAAQDWAKSRGVRTVILVITPDAENDQGLTEYYRKLGYVDSKRITMYREI